MAKVFGWPVRRGAYELLIQGCSASAIAAEVGVPAPTVGRWARLAGMAITKGRAGGLAHRVDMDAVPVPGPKGRGYRRLTLADRSFIQAARAMPVPLSIRAIAGELGVAPSTVSREVRAHQIPGSAYRRGRYVAQVAHHRAVVARNRDRSRRLDDPVLRAEVVQRLNQRFSPEQIAGQLRVDFPDRQEMWVSHETIYQALYIQGKGALRHELSVEKALRSGRTGRVPRSKLPRRSNRGWITGAQITDRPAEVSDRAVPGHWEGDLIVGPDNSAVVTLIERHSRYALLGLLPARRDSPTVTQKLIHMIESLPHDLRRTITWDQGVEMADHADITIAIGTRLYFCDPHAPWQRPSNENLNGLIRDFYPKGTNFNLIPEADIAHTQYLLNIRPRKIHAFHTPAAKMAELLNGVALEP